MLPFFFKNLISFELDNFTNIIYTDKIWFFFSDIISILLISFFIILLGILFPNKAKIIKFLNLISSFYLLIYFYLTNNNYICNIENINIIFEQNYNLYVKFFFFLAVITLFIFFLSISDIFYLEENIKIEYTLLILFVYIGALLLISSLDFISIIILLECISFSSYVLVGFERKNKFSTSAAIKYLILASIPSGFFILGVGLLYHNFGSFYQDYIELLLVSFDKFNLSPLDWIYSIQYYTQNINKFNNLFFLQTENYFFNYFFKYVLGINNFLQMFNPQLIFIIMHLEDLLEDARLLKKSKLYEKDFFLDGIVCSMIILEIENHFGFEIWKTFQYLIELNFLENDAKRFFFYNNNIYLDQIIFVLETFYIFLIEQYYMVTWILFTFKNINDTLGIFTPIIFEQGIVDNFVFFFKDFPLISQNILNWYSFISFDIFVEAGRTLKVKENPTQELIFNFFRLNLFQNANLARLNEEVFLIPNIKFFFYTDYINVFYKTFLIENYFTLIKKLNNFIEIQYVYNLNLDYLKNTIIFFGIQENIENFLEISFFYKDSTYPNQRFFYNYLNSFSEETLLDLCIYNNIFLSTYLAIIFILINLSFKITAAPFHFWAPTVYGNSPLPTITFLSIFSKLTIIFLIINLFLTVFDNLKFIWQPFLFFLGIFSVIISILGAFSEKLFKRFFVYSSIGHVGFMILGIAVLNYDGIQGCIDYLILYVISSFIIWIIVMFLTKKTTHLINFKGLSYNFKALSFILVLSLFSISGLPPMGGFFVKFEIFYGLLNSSYYYMSYILFLLTVFSFFYYLRLIKIIYFEDNKIIKKFKNLNNIKLRLISILIFILPLYILLFQEPFFYIIKNIIINSLT